MCMANHKIISLLFACIIPGYMQSQNNNNRKPWQTYFEQLSDYDDIESRNLEDLYDHLCELETSPIDLNTATHDDIKQLTFLNPNQQEELSEYIDRYRPLRSIGELAMIRSLDPLRLQLLRNFVYVGKVDESSSFPSLKTIFKYGKSELTAAVRIPFYDREGDRNGYLGYKYKHWFRYSFKYGKYVQAGLTGTQDAGEPFFSGGNSLGYDHYAYYITIRQLGILKTLALGQYKANFGLGLTVNTGFTLGKAAALVMSPATNKISPNSSRADAYYLQGAAATIDLSEHVDFTAFISYRPIDATLNDDGTIKTILKTGYHRTISEMQRKHNASQFATGGSIGWHSNGWHAGINGVYTSFNRELKPNTSQLFRKHAPSGKTFGNASADYGYASHRININGETAINSNGALATLNCVSLKASSTLSLSTIQRYYSYRYYSLFASAFSDGGKVQNESGIYIGATWTPTAWLSTIAYTDFAYFPWARYGVSESSHSWDNLIQTSFVLSGKVTLNTRYRFRIKQHDIAVSASSKTLSDIYEHRTRLAVVYTNNKWTAKTQIDAVCVASSANNSNSLGGIVTQNVGYTNSFLNIAANIGFFYTQDYDSRIYVYERSTLYSFSFPMFYGKGIRSSLFARANITKNLVLIGKIGTTKYFDRDVISSSYQQINSSWQTDLDLQIKWKF